MLDRLKLVPTEHFRSPSIHMQKPIVTNHHPHMAIREEQPDLPGQISAPDHSSSKYESQDVSLSPGMRDERVHDNTSPYGKQKKSHTPVKKDARVGRCGLYGVLNNGFAELVGLSKLISFS